MFTRLEEAGALTPHAVRTTGGRLSPHLSHPWLQETCVESRRQLLTSVHSTGKNKSSALMHGESHPCRHSAFVALTGASSRITSAAQPSAPRSLVAYEARRSR
jgi:hypothetical protein